MKDVLLKLKLDMIYRGISREEAAKRYDAAQAAQAVEANKSSGK